MKFNVEQNCFVSLVALNSPSGNRFNTPQFGFPQRSPSPAGCSRARHFSLLKHNQQNQNPKTIEVAVSVRSGLFSPSSCSVGWKKHAGRWDAWMGHSFGGHLCWMTVPETTEWVDQQWRCTMQIRIFPLVVKKQHKILPRTISLHWAEIFHFFFDTLNSHLTAPFRIMTRGKVWIDLASTDENWHFPTDFSQHLLSSMKINTFSHRWTLKKPNNLTFSVLLTLFSFTGPVSPYPSQKIL